MKKFTILLLMAMIFSIPMIAQEENRQTQNFEQVEKAEAITEQYVFATITFYPFQLEQMNFHPPKKCGEYFEENGIMCRYCWYYTDPECPVRIKECIEIAPTSGPSLNFIDDDNSDLFNPDNKITFESSTGEMLTGDKCSETILEDGTALITNLYTGVTALKSVIAPKLYMTCTCPECGNAWSTEPGLDDCPSCGTTVCYTPYPDLGCDGGCIPLWVEQ